METRTGLRIPLLLLGAGGVALLRQPANRPFHIVPWKIPGIHDSAFSSHQGDMLGFEHLQFLLRFPRLGAGSVEGVKQRANVLSPG